MGQIKIQFRFESEKRVMQPLAWSILKFRFIRDDAENGDYAGARVCFYPATQLMHLLQMTLSAGRCFVRGWEKILATRLKHGETTLEYYKEKKPREGLD